jgi:hypothetical protein
MLVCILCMCRSRMIDARDNQNIMYSTATQEQSRIPGLLMPTARSQRFSCRRGSADAMAMDAGQS